MAAHKSAISIGLIFVPVSLSKTTRETGISFNQLCKDENGKYQRIRYKKICPSCNVEIQSSDIIKGYEYEKGKYVTISNEELERMKSKKDKTIHILHFANMKEIDFLLFERDYYAIPENHGEKAFELLRQALFTLKKVAIGKTVMGTKEELILLYPTKNSLIAKVLYYYDELQPIPNISKVQIDKNELEMAKNLIDSMTKPFEHDSFYDEYQTKLKEAIQAKIGGLEIVSTSEDVPENALDLMSALQKSLEMVQEAQA